MSDISALRRSVIALATARLGLGEIPPGSNRGELPDKANEYVGASLSSPWCCAGVCYMLHLAGVLHGPRTASSGAAVAWGKAHSAIVQIPQYGDMGFVIDPTSETGYRHTVLIVGGTLGVYRTIEFNEGNRVKRGLRLARSLTCLNPYACE